MRPPRSRRWAIALAAATAGAALLGWQWQPADAASQPSMSASQAASATSAGGAGAAARATPTSPFGPAGSTLNQQQLAAWQERFVRAEQVYASYRVATRYPPESRPIAEHPDQVRPFDPIAEETPLRDASGKPAKGVRVRTTQERVFVAGNESVKFTIEAADENGIAVPLTVERSTAQGMPDTKLLITLIRATVPFADNGAAPDDAAGDGKYSARLAPAAQGFANHAGTIRVLADVTAAGQKGVVAFDIVYTPTVPATWAGAREALENGSLNLYLKAQVAMPGRYVVSARVYDGNGVPFALLQFNDVVPAGAAEFKLTLAGALVRDKNPAFPLRLVDVDGFLLQPDTFPDRAMMARQLGEVHVSKRYAVSSFSDAEWDSEERARYLAEYGKDMQQALDEMAKLRGK